MEPETMKTYEQLAESAKEAISMEDDDKTAELLCEALGHLQEFSWKTGVVWERDTVRNCCHEIGELIYDKAGIDKMQEIYRMVYAKMKGVAARYLEHFWNGCGDGEWRS